MSAGAARPPAPARRFAGVVEVAPAALARLRGAPLKPSRHVAVFALAGRARLPGALPMMGQRMPRGGAQRGTLSC